jgi:glycogen operon protein
MSSHDRAQVTQLGAAPIFGGTRFRVRSPRATAVSLCLFDGAIEHSLPMQRDGEDFTLDVADIGPGHAYGYRASGQWSPQSGLWFDPAKLLVDPYAQHIDRRFTWSPLLAQHDADTAAIVPRALVPGPLPIVPHEPPRFSPGGLIYELNVRSFTMLHPDVPVEQRGTLAALAHPAVIAHLKKLGVSAVELMPITAWIDERHLPPLGLTNAWGYNPVCFMALDPAFAPNGIVDLRSSVAALHDAGIGVILDVVFNHSGESDIHGPILSLRGLDNQAYAHDSGGRLINDTGTGNTLDFAQEPVRRLMLDSLRHFVAHAGIDGFRFDLAPIIARSPAFDPAAPIFAAIAADPLLHDRIMIAEPWDIGPGGYQLGRFPSHWLEWNDRYRDDVRHYWHGTGSAAALATRLAGSSDLFGESRTRSVNFIAAHDGMTLADLTAYEQRHNHANGEGNRDGHHDNISWNNGAEGVTDDPFILSRRATDIRALLATLFASRGAIMLTAGDEFGRTQHGNNNAYAQDNPGFWIDWQGRDTALEDFTATLARWRAAHPAISDPAMRHDLVWLRLDGGAMSDADWHDPAAAGFILRLPMIEGPSLDIRFDRVSRTVTFSP